MFSSKDIDPSCEKLSGISAPRVIATVIWEGSGRTRCSIPLSQAPWPYSHKAAFHVAAQV